MEKRRRRRQRNRKKSSLLSNVILGIAIAMLLFSGYKLYTIFSEYNKGSEEYEEIISEAVEIVPANEEAESETGGEAHTPLKVDFKKLKAVNKDTVAWIYFDEPSQINYPVVRGSDNDKYLKTTFQGQQNAAGTLFVDAGNAGDFSDRNTFIYGHNMKNRSMFGNLRKYKDEAFCKENPYFYIYTPDGKEVKYQVFATCIVEDTSETYDKYYANDTEFLKYIEHIRKISRYDVDVEITAESKIVSLSTCTNVTETQRLVVHGVKISETVIGE